jgi:hypothetical protein
MYIFVVYIVKKELLLFMMLQVPFLGRFNFVDYVVAIKQISLLFINNFKTIFQFNISLPFFLNI